MSPATRKHQQLILLEPSKAALLEALSQGTGIPKQKLLREAVDDLLLKHRAQIGLPDGTLAGNILPLKSKGVRAADRYFDEMARNLGLKSFAQLEKQVEIALGAARKKKRPNPK